MICSPPEHNLRIHDKVFGVGGATRTREGRDFVRKNLSSLRTDCRVPNKFLSKESRTFDPAAELVWDPFLMLFDGG
jgi:hypothetical protein